MFTALKLVALIMPAVFATADEFSDALRKDSPGGKKITKEEAKIIADEFLRKLAPRVRDALNDAIEE